MLALLACMTVLIRVTTQEQELFALLNAVSPAPQSKHSTEQMLCKHGQQKITGHGLSEWEIN